MLRTFYATSFLSCVGILRHDSRDGAHENVNSYNVTTLGKRGELCRLARGCNFVRDNVTNTPLSPETDTSPPALSWGYGDKLKPNRKSAKLSDKETKRFSFNIDIDYTSN